MIVAGAAKTINYQQFKADAHELPDKGHALVFTEPDGTAHVFAITDEKREEWVAEFTKARVQTASAQDLANLGQAARGPTDGKA